MKLPHREKRLINGQIKTAHVQACHDLWIEIVAVIPFRNAPLEVVQNGLVNMLSLHFIHLSPGFGIVFFEVVHNAGRKFLKLTDDVSGQQHDLLQGIFSVGMNQIHVAHLLLEVAFDGFQD